ncbi:protein-disulfide isomerase [Sphingobium wenxiniae]|uniref:Protein-disulfide isomerase n=1 Tax=Sphingobium wenxiniae (strain DSM 21828 / CGMCC 1.7748 / JZ-1) TaxID=595605 RepID=A0A562K7D5_SPHWJ|nr:DsbA family protein [Sphingobium wenxiniae]MBB6192771.1 protein-disulfide isomerase [Sphingobium wenxiniae]TWH91361.1 protein-disulfide isomerase [Sphingobium wenxiniae]
MKKLALVGMLGAVALGAGVVAVRAGGDDGRAHAQSTAGSTDTDSQASAEGARIRHEIQNDPVAPTVAPQGYDVTIVFFSDYQCPYCRKVHPVLEDLMREDKKVKLVHRDWPIFGAASTEAAKAAIASKYQGKHAAFNDALMRSQGKLSSESIRAAADRAGVDWARLQGDLAAHRTEIDQTLSRSSRYAAMMGLSGTPAMLVGNYLIPGAVDLSNMREAVAMARSQGQQAQTQ